MVQFNTFARGQTAVLTPRGSNARTINAIVTDYKRFVDVVNDEAHRIMQGAAEIVLEAIKPHVPVMTGALLASGKAETEETGKGVMAVVSFGGDTPVVGPNSPDGFVDYAILVNYEEGRDPYMESGIEDSREEVKSYIQTEFLRITS